MPYGWRLAQKTGHMADLPLRVAKLQTPCETTWTLLVHASSANCAHAGMQVWPRSIARYSLVPVHGVSGLLASFGARSGHMTQYFIQRPEDTQDNPTAQGPDLAHFETSPDQTNHTCDATDTCQAFTALKKRPHTRRYPE
jgi:hypothetical protein